MHNSIATFQVSTEEDLDVSWTFVSGYDPTGRTLEVAIRDRASATVKATLTLGAGLTLAANKVAAKVAKAAMSAWERTEYSADLVDKTGGAFKRIVPTRFVYDEPGRLVGGARGAAFTIVVGQNQAIITSVGGPGVQGLKGDKGDKGDTGVPGAGAPNSADILAIPEMARLERSLTAAGVPDEASLILDFIRGVQFASRSAIAASIMTLLAALGGASVFSRPSTATYFDRDGLLKTALSNVPRLEYDPVTRLPRGLLIENQARTNVLLGSEAMGAAPWAANEMSVVSNAGVAPDGLSTADKMVPTTTNSAHFEVNFSPMTIVSGQTYGASIFVKAAGYTKGIVRLTDATLGVSGIYFDTVTGTITGTYGTVPIRSDMTACGNGWFRLRWATVATGSAAGSSTMVTSILNASGAEIFAGNGSDGMYFWGGQVEGGWPSSYIPTGASAVARAAEVLIVGGGQWLTGSALSTMLEVRLSDIPAAPLGAYDLISVRDGPYNNLINFRAGAVLPGADFITYAGGVNQIYSAPYAIAVGTVARLCAGVDSGGFGYAKDNVLTSTGGANTFPPGLDQLVIGSNGFMGHIRRVLVWPQRLSNTKVQALSNQAAWS